MTDISPRQFKETKLVLASHNADKLDELVDFMMPFAVQIVTPQNLGLSEPEETGDSFVANAELKASMAAIESKLPALADDSGLVVRSLDGAPGVYSARWGGENRDFGEAMAKVERKLFGKKDRSAYFSCALALAWPDSHLEVFEGRVEGSIVWPPRGGLGFGYDPIFTPCGEHRTFGEMPYQEKKLISHRAEAFKLLVDACFRG